MNPLDMLSEMQQAPTATVHLMKVNYGNDWHCSIETELEGTVLKIKKEAATPERAIVSCYEAYNYAIGKGVSQLSPKMISATPRPTKSAFPDDEIPF